MKNEKYNSLLFVLGVEVVEEFEVMTVSFFILHFSFFI
jgi:hypothetical protein